MPHGADASGPASLHVHARRARRLPSLTPFVGWLVGAAWFFRTPLLSGFAHVHGDPGDTRLLAVLREHWWRVVRGEVGWLDPGFFHPWKDVLGYSDTFLLESVFYMPWRAAGVEPLLAAQLTVITLSGVGFAGWWVLLGRLGLADHRWRRLGLTLLGTFPHQLAQQVLHQQLQSVWWLPWALVLGHVAVTATPRQRIVAGCSAGLLWGLVLSSTVYIGWFVVFVASLLAVVVVAGETIAGRGRRLVAVVRGHLRPIVAAATGFVVGLIPFVLVYLPALRDRGERPYWAVSHFGPRPFDLFNVGRDNLAWGAVLRALAPGDHHRLANIEVAMAVSPVLLVAATVAWWRSPRPSGDEREGGPGRRRIAGALLLVAAMALLLPVEWGPWSAWRVVHAVVPGAGALRVAGRLWIVAHVLVVLALAIVVGSAKADSDGEDRTNASPGRRRLAALGGLLLVVALAAEQLDLADRAVLDRRADLALVASAADPPEWCQVIAVAGGDTSFLLFTPSVDAMRIASALDIPTVHGYSGQFPPRYPIAHDADDYRRRFRRYVRRLELTEAICVFDLDQRVWLEEPLSVG